jgi:hypothetical protein
MSVGILESVNDPFMGDLVSRLNDVEIEFIALSAETVPLKHQYSVVVDRLSFCYPFFREIMKSLSLNGAYVINNPFTLSATNKIIDINIANQLGLSFPRTIALPPKTAFEEMDGIVAQPDFNKVIEDIGLPCVLKPYDGYGWQDVYVIASIEELRERYTALSDPYTLIVQQFINFKDYYRAFCFDKKEVLFIKWIPRPEDMGSYLSCDRDTLMGNKDRLVELTINFNKALDLDVNVIEWCVDQQGKWWVIDAFNAFPDIAPEAIPAECYAWILEKFADCIRDKLQHPKQNRIPFCITQPGLII